MNGGGISKLGRANWDSQITIPDSAFRSTVATWFPYQAQLLMQAIRIMNAIQIMHYTPEGDLPIARSDAMFLSH